MPVKAVLLDFYGTLAEMPSVGPSWDAVLAEAGYTLTEGARRRYWQDGIDGSEHDEHSRSRDHYVAWQRARTSELLAACGVPAGDHDALIDVMHGHLHGRPITAYDEALPVLRELRDRGVSLAICSNWDWDLLEAVDRAGLDGTVDVVVSSAWVGARKPHPRIYAHTLDLVGVAPDDVLFVGDTWACDVEGPRAAGLRTMYLRRPHFGVDHTAPDDPGAHTDVHQAGDLTRLLDLV